MFIQARTREVDITNEGAVADTHLHQILAWHLHGVSGVFVAHV